MMEYKTFHKQLQFSFITLPAALQYLPSFGKTIILHSII